MPESQNTLNQIEKKFAQIIQQIFPDDFPKKIVIAVSGGIDSMALAFLLQKICLQKKCELICVTINHKLRKESDEEVQMIYKIMQKNSLPHFILNSYFIEAPSVDIEASLREMRYNLLSKFCVENKIKYLFIAHHKQDISENFLIRLFRGSGIDGLAALDYISDFKELKLIRPLLDFEKDDLEKYLSAKKISYFHDKSNDDEKYLRNKIRKFLNSFEDKKLINERVLKATKSILESKKLIEESMLEGSDKILQFFDLGYFLVNLNNFKTLPQQKAWRYLAWILMDVSGNFYKPRLEDLNNLYQWILLDKNHKARSLYGCIVEKYNDENLIIYREKSKIKSVKLKNNLLWDNRFLIKINSKLLGKEIIVDIARPSEINDLSKEIPSLKKLKNPLKKIYFTIPVFRKENKIIAIPQIGFSSKIDVEIIFKAQSKLIKNDK